jgi:hypothetical protein
MTIGRSVVAGLAGIVAAGATVALVEAATHAVASGERAFGGAVLGYGAGSLVGSALAMRLSGGPAAAAAVPLMLGVLAGINLASFRHPDWFAPAALVALGAGWWAGTRARR